MRRVGVLAVLLTAIPAKADGQTVVDTMVVNGTPTWGTEPRLIEELRIGTLVGDPNEAFGHIGGVLALADGSIWISDRQLGAIKRFGPSGEYLGQVGRHGQGPGEFRYPQGMRQLPSGEVVVWDDGQIRLSLFTQEGVFLRSFTPPTYMIGTPMEELELDRTRSELLLMSGTMMSGSRDDHRLYWLRLSVEGEVLDTIPIEPSGRGDMADEQATLNAFSPLGYRIVGRNDDYSMSLEVSPDRHIVLMRPWKPVRYANEERAEKQRLAELFSERNGRPAGRVPETKPAFSRLQVDEEGRIWVSMFSEGLEVGESDGARAAREEACEFFGAPKAECDRGIRRWNQAAVYEVLDPQGGFYGRVRLPNHESTLVAARDQKIWVIETGPLGEEYVVRYRLVPG